MPSTEPFALFDCSLARYAVGRSCSNLRMLLDAIRTVPDMVLEHHMMRCALDDPFELYEFPNDLARWCWEALGDQVLAEELSLVDPYAHPTIGALRATLVNVIEEQLWSAEQVRDCRPGLELHLVGSRLACFDTGERFSTLAALAEALPRITLRSFFYHVHEAHRRHNDHDGHQPRNDASDDFSAWLEGLGAEESLVTSLRSVDFYFLNLGQLRSEFIEIFRHYLLPQPQVVARTTA
ncbi:MAG TPA: DUF5752 family protein [Gemmataceae bacterium]|nr:DUF5752 family protein [Gemmataceae bacterium]